MEQKGEFNGLCNVSSCQSKRHVTWYHTGTRKYYCNKCARELNEANPEAIDYYGHPLLVNREWDSSILFGHPDSLNVLTVEGNLLRCPADYTIAHQCNCTTKTVSGVAKAIFEKWPESNTYFGPNGRGSRLFGSFTLARQNSFSPRIANLNTQRDKGKPRSKFEEVERLIAFSHCLSWLCDKLLELPRHIHLRDSQYQQAIALPYLIGSDLAGGKWENYYHSVAAVAKEYPNIQFIFVKLPEKELVKIKD